jgi:hypothetical protein
VTQKPVDAKLDFHKNNGYDVPMRYKAVSFDFLIIIEMLFSKRLLLDISMI